MSNIFERNMQKLLAVIVIVAAFVFLTIHPFNGDKQIASSLSEDIAKNVDILSSQKKLHFLKNAGQWNKSAFFAYQKPGANIWFEKNAFTIHLHKKNSKNEINNVVTKMIFHNSNDNVDVIGEKIKPNVKNYFLSNDKTKWQVRVPEYEQLLYQGLYDGIDMRVRTHNGNLEYDLLLEPNADLKDIVVKCEGIINLEIEADGTLLINTELESVYQKPPCTWQAQKNGERIPVKCEYRLIDDTSFGFLVPDLNPALALVIDPGLEWSTLLGGTSNDEPGYMGLKIADNGDVLFCGRTNSLEFPATTGVFSTDSVRNYDIFVTRWNPGLSGNDQLVWSTFIGGEGYDHANVLEIDSNGDLIVGGQAGSADFPVTDNAFNTVYNGGESDGFIAKLNSSGTELQYSSFLGGDSSDFVWDLVLDNEGRIVTYGETMSSDLPVTTAAFDTSHNGNIDVFVSILNTSKSGDNQLEWSSFFGGSDEEVARSLVIDASGIITISGDVWSDNLPTTANAYNETFNALIDAFIAQFDINQTGNNSLINSTYFGSNGQEWNNFIDIQQNGLVTLVGTTWSDEFPLTENAYSTKGAQDHTIYISRFDFSKNGQDQLIYSSYVSGDFHDVNDNVIVDDSGRIYVVGQTASAGFPTTPDAIDRTYTGRGDCIIFCLNPQKTGKDQLEFSTLMGSEWLDRAMAIAIDSNKNIFIAGRTDMVTFPVTGDAYQTVFGGARDVFMAKIVPGNVSQPSKEFLASCTGSQVIPAVSTVAHARANFELNADSTELSYEIAAAFLQSNITGIHFHHAPKGSAGNIVKTVSNAIPAAYGSFRGTWSVNDDESLTPELVEALCRENIYVSIKTDSLPNGEIRGQILDTSFESIARAETSDFYASLGRRSGDDSGSLIKIDPLSGAGALIGSMNIVFFNFSPPVGGLAINSKGEIFATHNNGQPNLWRIDALSGAGTMVASTDLWWLGGMAFDMNDRLYVSSAESALSRVNTESGKAEHIGIIGLVMTGMAFDPTDNTLWASLAHDLTDSRRTDESGLPDAIYTIDVTTAKATLVGTTGLGDAVPDIVFDENGNLYGISGGGQRPNDLIAIDKESGKGTLIGPVGFKASALSKRIPKPQGPQISIDARAIDVGYCEVGKSTSRTITMTNYGTENLIITAVAEPGKPFNFTGIPDLPLEIPPEGSETFSVHFSPDSSGQIEHSLAITSNDAETPVLERNLFGNAVNLNNISKADTGVVYASTGIRDGGRLISINKKTGAGTVIGNTGLVGVDGLACNSHGTLLAIERSHYDNDVQSIYQLDAATGGAVKMSTTNLNLPITTLVFDENDNIFGSIGNGLLFKIDTLNFATSILAETNEAITGLGFNPIDNTLWASTGSYFGPDQADKILKIDKNTGAVMVVGKTGLGGEINDIFFDNNGNLFGSKRGTSSDTLISINKTDARGTVIGPIGYKAVNGLTTKLNFISSDINELNTFAPEKYALAQNYPNPFNPSTTIQYNLPELVHVKIIIYDILGRKVRTLVDAIQPAGHRKTVWDGRNENGERVSSGLFIYRMEAGSYKKARKLMLIK